MGGMNAYRDSMEISYQPTLPGPFLRGPFGPYVVTDNMGKLLGIKLAT